MAPEPVQDLGIPLPGSDPDRRRKIKEQIRFMKVYLRYLSLYEAEQKELEVYGDTAVETTEAVT